MLRSIAHTFILSDRCGTGRRVVSANYACSRICTLCSHGQKYFTLWQYELMPAAGGMKYPKVGTLGVLARCSTHNFQLGFDDVIQIWLLPLRSLILVSSRDLGFLERIY